MFKDAVARVFNRPGASGAAMILLAAIPAFAADFDWSFLNGLPKPVVPADNPMSRERVELGRYLFYDTRLSVNGRQSCASCHRQELAFTDGLAHAQGTTGEIHPRGSMSVVNIAYAPRLTWAHPSLTLLEEQALVPLLGADPVELGLKEKITDVLAAFRDDPVYARVFPAAFPGEAEPFTRGNLIKALASFQRTIVSARSPYDRYRRGERDAISESAKRGEIIFFSGEKAGCFQCHGGWNFSGPLRFEGRTDTEIEFHNTALHNLDGPGSYAPRNTGIHEHTGRAEDLGRFRAPTLRNIAVTAPYMHDGSLATLEEVIAHYAAGGRAARNAQRSPILRRFRLTPEETADLIAFLNSLTDEALLRDPRWSDPWPPARP